MLQKLIVGRFIHFRYPPPPNGCAPQHPAVFMQVPQTFMAINESKGVFTKTSSTTIGAHDTKPWRTFGWLPWLAGSIAEVAMGGFDVLTGPMSGCDLVLYRRNNVVYAGHLGTDVGATEQNASIKAVWNDFATNAGANNIIGGFNPLRDWVGPFPQPTGLDTGGPMIMGLYSSNHDFYTLVLYSQKISKTNNNAHLSLRRIAGVQQIQSMNYNTLCNL